MVCHRPPALTLDQLSTALDGMAGADIQDHLTHCPACSARLAELRAGEHRLVRQLYRWDCPPVAQLSDYQLGLLSEAETEPLTRHLAHCPHCQSELTQLRHYLASEPAAPPPPAAQRLRTALGEMVARLLPAAPALALRGSGPEPIMAEAGDLLIVLNPQPRPDGEVTVIGQMVTPEPVRWQGALVLVRQADEVRMTTTLDDIGTFQCPALPPGITEFKFTPRHGPTVIVRDVNLPG